MIQSVSYNQFEILKSILSLHCISNIELDATYGNGGFYKHGIVQPQYKFDINPKFSDVLCANAENLPLADETISTAIFDPPFLATTGKSLSIDNGSNSINKRYGVYSSEMSLHRFYVNSMIEFHRILKRGGILIFKCQDKVSSGKQYMSHSFIIHEAMNIGFYVKDLFILVSKHRLVANWQLKNQKHARKYHCYFLVLQKDGCTIQYK